MSKLKQMIVSAFAVCALAVGVGINPVTAYAEDSAVIPEISAEIETSEEVVEDSESVENSEDIEVNPFISKTFTHEENGERIELTIVDEENAVADMWDKGMPFAKVYLTYVWTGEDTLELRAMDGSYFDEVRLYESGFFEVVEGTLNPSPSEDIETKEENAVEDTNEVVLPVICGIAGIVGCALIALIVGKNWSKIKASFDAIIEWLKKKKEAITNEELDLAEIKSRISDYIKRNEELKALLDLAYKENGKEFEKFAELIKEAVRTVLGEYEKIKKALLLITQGEAELVQRGVADEVLKLLGVPAEEKKE